MRKARPKLLVPFENDKKSLKKLANLHSSSSSPKLVLPMVLASSSLKKEPSSPKERWPQFLWSIPTEPLVQPSKSWNFYHSSFSILVGADSAAVLTYFLIFNQMSICSKPTRIRARRDGKSSHGLSEILWSRKVALKTATYHLEQNFNMRPICNKNQVLNYPSIGNFKLRETQ